MRCSSQKESSKQIEQRNRVPQQDDVDEQAQRKGVRREPGDSQLNSQQKGQDNDANLDQPGQPEPLIENGLHVRVACFRSCLQTDRLLVKPNSRFTIISAEPAIARPTTGRLPLYLASQFGDHREQRHVQRNDDAADHDAQETDDDRFQQANMSLVAESTSSS